MKTLLLAIATLYLIPSAFASGGRATFAPREVQYFSRDGKALEGVVAEFSFSYIQEAYLLGPILGGPSVDSYPVVVKTVTAVSGADGIARFPQIVVNSGKSLTVRIIPEGSFDQVNKACGEVDYETSRRLKLVKIEAGIDYRSDYPPSDPCLDDKAIANVALKLTCQFTKNFEDYQQQIADSIEACTRR